MVMLKVRRTCLVVIGFSLCVVLVVWNVGAGVLWPRDCTDLLASRRLEYVLGLFIRSYTECLLCGFFVIECHAFNVV